ncbi:MAG TPA: hypothetical protein VFQ39_12700 [Longimicrobium sp.]|nr:hypothetical protein [Longimicrobium sp.]
MLAYVFWHWRRPEVAADEYERLQRDFHAALGDAPPPGFARSYSHALTGAAWASDCGEAYEDWYLVEGSAALDPLNEAAVTASRRRPHDAAAAVAANGTAGLYRLRLGEAPMSPRFAAWFAKPAGISYDDAWRLLGPLTDAAGVGVWVRQMVLGPSPEFCVQADRPVALPDAIQPLVLPLRPVWPG